jgi:hypothetical protein
MTIISINDMKSGTAYHAFEKGLKIPNVYAK